MALDGHLAICLPQGHSAGTSVLGHATCHQHARAEHGNHNRRHLKPCRKRRRVLLAFLGPEAAGSGCFTRREPPQVPGGSPGHWLMHLESCALAPPAVLTCPRVAMAGLRPRGSFSITQPNPPGAHIWTLDCLGKQDLFRVNVILDRPSGKRSGPAAACAHVFVYACRRGHQAKGQDQLQLTRACLCMHAATGRTLFWRASLDPHPLGHSLPTSTARTHRQHGHWPVRTPCTWIAQTHAVCSRDVLCTAPCARQRTLTRSPDTHEEP